MGRFAVTIVQPPGYPHSAAFQEVGETLLHGLRALGHDAVLGADAPAGRRAIVLGSNLLGSAPLPLGPDAVLYNLEQVEPGSPWLTPDLLARFRRHEVWDYSERNAARYRELGLARPRVVPIGWVPELTRIAPAPVEDLDVLFYGSVNPRRQAVLDALRRAGLRVEAVFGVYGEARDRLIARAKVVLNVHYFEAKVFEVVRVSYLLANRRCVVSERGSEPEEERELEPAVAFAAYDGLVEACLRLARDPAERARRGAIGFELISRRDEAAILHPVVGGTLPPRAAAAPSPQADADATAPALAVEELVAAAAPSGRRILLAGCGDGALGAGLLRAGAAEVVGLDACARGLTRSRLTATYRVAPDAAPELPYPDGYFDLLLVEDLSSLQVAGPTLRHLRRWLADDGRLVAVAHNATHEGSLTALLATGRWPEGAGRSPLTVGAALEALEAGGFEADDEVAVVRTEPGAAADVLRQLREALGVDGAAATDGLTLARAVLRGRPAARLGASSPTLFDPWRGGRPVKVLLAPDLSDPGDPWIEALGGLARGLPGDGGVTVGVALPAARLASPPPGLEEAVAGSQLEVRLFEVPDDEPGWLRLLAGATTWLATAPRPELQPLARLVGVDVQRAG